MFRTAINHAYLSTAVRALELASDELIEIQFIDPTSVIQFTAPAHPDCRTLVMPMKMQ